RGDSRTLGQRAMQALRDAVKFALGRIGHTKLPGADRNHTPLIVVTDYPTPLHQLRHQPHELLPEIETQRREMLLQVLANTELTKQPAPDAHQDPTPGEFPGAFVDDHPDHGDSSVIQLPTAATQLYLAQGTQPPPHNGPAPRVENVA